MRLVGVVLASVLVVAAAARAQDIPATVTWSDSHLDIRAVDPAGTAYALNLDGSFSQIWASTDDARTWTARGRDPLGYSFKFMTALADGTLLAEVQGGGGFTITRSTDHGATWKHVLSLGQYEVLTPHIWAESRGTAYLLEYQSSTQASVPIRPWASTDSGATWSVRHTFEGHRHGHSIRVDPSGRLWAFFGDLDAQCTILRSSDGGTTWTTVLAGSQQARVADTVFLANVDILYKQDIPDLPASPHIIRMTPDGVQTDLGPLPGPSYSIHALPTGGFLLGETREPTGTVYAPNDVSAHLFGSADGTSWAELGAYPRIDAADYARADVTGCCAAARSW